MAEPLFIILHTDCHTELKGLWDSYYFKQIQKRNRKTVNHPKIENTRKGRWPFGTKNVEILCLGAHGKYGTRSDAWGEQRHRQELWTAGNVVQVQMPEENKDTCRYYELLAMWHKLKCLRKTKTRAGIMKCWQCGTRSNAWEQRHRQELWNAGIVAHVQTPEENKDTCRKYRLPQFGIFPNLSSSSLPLTHTKFTVHRSTFSCIEFDLAYWRRHLNLPQKM